MPDRIAKRVLLIGWDGADWQHITPLLDSGELPGLERLINGGVMGNLTTLSPILSPMLWNSIATGKTAEKHGILGFTEPCPDGKSIRPSSSYSRRVKAVWNILHSRSMRSNVIYWWASHPAEEINGTVITNVFNGLKTDENGELKITPGVVHPASRQEELCELKVRVDELVADDITPFIPEAAKIDQKTDKRFYSLCKILTDCASIQSVTTRLLEKDDWDLTAVYFDAIDHFCHAFMPYHPPQMPNIKDEDFQMYKGVISGTYKFHDMMLQRLMHMVGEETTIILCSDHGFQSGHLRPRGTPLEPTGPAAWHRQHGIFIMAGPGIKSDQRIYGANIIDITPTILHMFGLPIGRDMDGRPLLDAFEETQKPAFINSWEDDPSPSGMHGAEPEQPNDPEQTAELLKQFVALGYIDDPGKNMEKAVADSRRELDYNLARVYMTSNRPLKAQEILLRLVEQASWEDRYWKNLARCFLETRHYDEAIQIILGLYSDQPKIPYYSKILLIRCYIASGQRELAEPMLDEIMADKPRFPSLLSILGKVHLDHRDLDRARALFEKALELDPDLASAHEGISTIHLRQGYNEKAVESALDAIGRLYRVPNAHWNLGVALMRMRVFDRAIEAFQALVRFNTSRYLPLAHRQLARIYRQQGNNELADKHAAMSTTEHKAKRQIVQSVINQSKQKIQLTEIPPSKVRQEKHLAERKPKRPNRDNREPSGKQFVIVSGLPRSGTSLMMQMLQACGLPPKTDGLRQADVDNPRGYYEWEDIKKLPSDPDLFDEPELDSKSIKVVSMLLPFLANHHTFKVIFMMRPIEQIVTSQQKMIDRTTSGPVDEKESIANSEAMKKKLVDHRDRILRFLEKAPEIDFLRVEFEDAVGRPEQVLNQLKLFLSDRISLAGTNIEEIVCKELHRNH